MSKHQRRTGSSIPLERAANNHEEVWPMCSEVLIDNTSGSYDPLDVVEKLQDYLQELGGDGGEVAETVFEIGQLPEDERYQALHEYEEELIRDINDFLPEDLVLTVGADGNYPGLYLLEEIRDGN